MGLHILITVPSLAREFGGPVVKAIGLAGALRARGHDVTLVGAGPADVLPGTLVLHVRWRFHGTPIPAELGRLIAGVRQAHVVHVIGFRDPIGTVAALAGRRRGVPVVLEPAGMHRRRLRSLWLKAMFDRTVGRLVVGRAAAVVATSTREAAELRADGVNG